MADRPQGRAAPHTPLWVKVFGGIAIVLVLVVVILHLTGNGFGGHMPAEPHGHGATAAPARP